MKTFNEFLLNERAGGPASPAGKARADKQAKQNQQNMQAKRRDPGASNPRGASSGPTQSMRDSAAKERNASRITKPAQPTPPTVTSKGSRLGGTEQTMTSTSRPANTIKAPSGFKKGTSSLQSKPIYPDRIKRNGATVPSEPESDYQAARKQRDISNRLDKEDKNKGRTWRELGSATKAVGKAAGKFATSKGKSGEDVETGKESGNVSGGSEYTSRTKRG